RLKGARVVCAQRFLHLEVVKSLLANLLEPSSHLCWCRIFRSLCAGSRSSRSDKGGPNLRLSVLHHFCIPNRKGCGCGDRGQTKLRRLPENCGGASRSGDWRGGRICYRI